MRFIQKVLASLPFKTMTFSGTLYHGSPTLVDDFDVAKGSGRYGKGLYLTPDLEIAKFYAEGGRQGAAGQRLKRGSGYIYEFKLSGKTLKVLDEGETLREMVGDLEKAEDAFSAVGDLFSKSVTKYLAEWANEKHNADIIWIASKDMGVHSPLEQVVVINQAVIKSWKLYKRVSQASKSATSEEVVKHLDNTSPREDLDNQYYDIGEYEEWELKKIPINKLDFTLANVSNKESKNLLNAYTPLKTQAPPIIIVPSEILGGKYRIVDGYHRVGAAKKRGEKEVMAYIPLGAS